MSPVPERISSGSLGAVNVLADPRGVKIGTGHYQVCPQHWVPWLVPTVAAGQVGAVCTGVVRPAVLAPPPPLRSRNPAHLRGAGAWVADNPRRGCRHSDGTPGGHHRQQRQHPRSCRGPQPCLDLQAGDGGCCMLWGDQIFRRYLCVCVCLCVFFFSDTTFKSFGLIFKVSIAASEVKIKKSFEKFSLSPVPQPPPVFLHVKDVVICGDDVRPIRVVWSDKDGERSLGLEALHKLLAQDPGLGLAVLRGVKEWEHGCQCSELWGPSRPYKLSLWALWGR